ncbi:lipopolysaccharide biosynthesis protein [Mycolicibacterium litorale]|uniref:lipopolysaccharide biosynthesis protein n=1 Tax=Mycolicibacterium litorale TaxID=758802 RepID=UPI003CEFB49F
MTIGKFSGLRFSRSPSALIVGRILATTLSLISAPIVSRAIGPEGRGETAAALALFLIIPVVVSIGMPMEVRRLAAIEEADAALRSARLVTTLSTIATVALGITCYFTLFASFDPFSRTAATLGVALSAIPASWALDVSVLVAHERFGAVALLQVIQPATYVLLIVAFWLLDAATVATVLIAFIVGNIANFVTGIALTRVPIRGGMLQCRTFLSRSFDFYAGSVAQIASTRLDQVLALPLIGAQQTGFYSVAVTIGSAPALVLGHALAGSIFRGIARAEGDERMQLQSAAIRSATALAMMCCPLLAIVAWPVVPWVFGADFEGALPATFIAIVAGGAQLIGFVASSAATACGKGRLLTSAQVGGLAVGLLALVPLGLLAGALGASIASAIGFIVTAIILSVSLRVRLTDLVPKPADFVGSLKLLWRR